MNFEERERLLAGVVTGDLSPEEAEDLLKACSEDEELRRRMVKVIQIDRLTGLSLEEDGEFFAEEFRLRVEADEDVEFSSEVVSRIRKSRLRAAVFKLSAIAAVILVSLVAFWDMKSEPVARLVRIESSDLKSGSREFEVGEKIVFERGLAEVQYFSGVRIVIEAPAVFEFTGVNQGFLHQGKLVAEVDDETAHGFIIDGPSGRLIDLGTKFAVEVEVSGEMEVHVIEGEVDAIATGGEPSRLVKDQAMRLADGHVQSLKADVGKFVTRLPEYWDQEPRVVRWSFDSTGDGIARDSAGTLADRNADARLLSFSGQGDGPVEVEAPFGSGLGFDGIDSFLESKYRGISGGQPRTVAFWVRVPDDFDRLQGYGIINWGDVKIAGGAWQVSVNGTEEDGPLGHLRIGTHWGQVIGTTDLRDGKWHHCAVVMYGDEEGAPNTATHILLYVDGELEPAARKSMRAVNTHPSPGGDRSPHGIWIGRNLGFEYEGVPDAKGYGRFFRGDLDEVIICDIALNQKQIRRLMKENRLLQKRL